jgi:hypothetical protein
MSDPVLYPKESWEWYGSPGHLCVGEWCHFHLCTKVGPWWISTIGGYVPPSYRPILGIEKQYEKMTMVFRAGTCDCDGVLCDGARMGSSTELEMLPANTAREARENHMAMCDAWSRKGTEGN